MKSRQLPSVTPAVFMGLGLGVKGETGGGGGQRFQYLISTSSIY